MEHVTAQEAASDPVGIWLRRSLSNAHNDILKAPLSDELAALVAEMSRAH